MMAAIGRVMCNAVPLVNAASPPYTSAAHVPIPPQDRDYLDFLWPPYTCSEVANAAQGEDGTVADEPNTARPDQPSAGASTPRPPKRPKHAPTPATARMAPPPRRQSVIDVAPVQGTEGNGARKCASCGTACTTEYCPCGRRVSRLPRHPRPPQAADTPPEAPATPDVTCCQRDDPPIQPTDSASQSRMDVDVDEAPFELTELDLAAATDTRAHAPALYDDSDDDLLGIHDPDLLDIPPA